MTLASCLCQGQNEHRAETAADWQVSCPYCCCVRGIVVFLVFKSLNWLMNTDIQVFRMMMKKMFFLTQLSFTAENSFPNIHFQMATLLWKDPRIRKNQWKIWWTFCVSPPDFSHLFPFLPSVSLLVHWFTELNMLMGCSERCRLGWEPPSTINVLSRPQSWWQ